MAKIGAVDSATGVKGRGMSGGSGSPSKKIKMAAPGEGMITKPDLAGDLSVRSAAHEADAWSNIGGAAGTHSYDRSNVPNSTSKDVAD